MAGSNDLSRPFVMAPLEVGGAKGRGLEFMNHMRKMLVITVVSLGGFCHGNTMPSLDGRPIQSIRGPV